MKRCVSKLKCASSNELNDVLDQTDDNLNSLFLVHINLNAFIY